MNGRDMPLLTELENVLGARGYKDFAPDGAGSRAPGAPAHRAAWVIFSRQNFWRAQSRNCKTEITPRSTKSGGGPPQSKTRGVHWSLPNGAQRLGLRQPSGALGRRNDGLDGARASARFNVRINRDVGNLLRGLTDGR
jgi:hypothetical protein